MEFRPTEINGVAFTFGLISRRCRFRAGTRYFSRGIDQNGNVSNFVETEQMVLVHAADGALRRLSYLQTRGSIPVKWAQVINAKYTPRLKVIQTPETVFLLPSLPQTN